MALLSVLPKSRPEARDAKPIEPTRPSLPAWAETALFGTPAEFRAPVFRAQAVPDVPVDLMTFADVVIDAAQCAVAPVGDVGVDPAILRAMKNADRKAAAKKLAATSKRSASANKAAATRKANAAAKKRSQSALKAAATRKANVAVKKRSEAAKRANETRKRNAAAKSVETTPETAP